MFWKNIMSWKFIKKIKGFIMGNLFAIQRSQFQKAADVDPVTKTTKAVPATFKDRLDTSESDFFPSWVYQGFNTLKRSSAIIFSGLFFKGLFTQGAVFVNPLSLFSEEGRVSVFQNLLDKSPKDALDYMYLFEQDLDEDMLVDMAQTYIESGEDEKTKLARQIYGTLGNSNPQACKGYIEDLVDGAGVKGEFLVSLFDDYKELLDSSEKYELFFEILDHSAWNGDSSKEKQNLARAWINADWLTESLKAETETDCVDIISNQVGPHLSFDSVAQLVTKVPLTKKNTISVLNAALKTEFEWFLEQDKDPANVATTMSLVDTLPDEFDQSEKQASYRMLFDVLEEQKDVDSLKVAEALLSDNLSSSTLNGIPEIVDKAKYFGAIYPQVLRSKVKINDAYPNNSLLEVAAGDDVKFSSDLFEDFLNKDTPKDFIKNFFLSLSSDLPSLADDPAGHHFSTLKEVVGTLAEKVPFLFFEISVDVIKTSKDSSEAQLYKDTLLDALDALDGDLEYDFYSDCEDEECIKLINDTFESFKLSANLRTKVAAKFLEATLCETPGQINMTRKSFQECFFKLSETAPEYLDVTFGDFFEKCVPVQAGGIRRSQWFFEQKDKISDNISAELQKYLYDDRCGVAHIVKNFDSQAGYLKPYLLLTINDEVKTSKVDDLLDTITSAKDWIEENAENENSGQTYDRLVEDKLPDLIGKVSDRSDKSLTEDQYGYLEQNIKVINAKLKEFFEGDTKDIQVATSVVELLSAMAYSDSLYLNCRDFLENVVPLAVTAFETDNSELTKVAKEIKDFEGTERRLLSEIARESFYDMINDSIETLYESQGDDFKGKYSPGVFSLGLFQTLFPKIIALGVDVEEFIQEHVSDYDLQSFLQDNDVAKFAQEIGNSIEYNKLMHFIKKELDRHGFDSDALAQELGLDSAVYEITDPSDPTAKKQVLKREVLPQILADVDLVKGKGELHIDSFKQKKLDGDVPITDYVFFA